MVAGPLQECARRPILRVHNIDDDSDIIPIDRKARLRHGYIGRISRGLVEQLRQSALVAIVIIIREHLAESTGVYET